MVEPFTQKKDSDFMVEESEAILSTNFLEIDPPQYLIDAILQFAHSFNVDSVSPTEELS